MEDGRVVISPRHPCLMCLHCAAVCPAGAVLWQGEAAASPMPKAEDCSKAVEQLILRRRSYRYFEPRPVEKELLTQALRTADWAPSAKNRHQLRWVLVSGKEKVDGLISAIVTGLEESGADPFLLKALKAGKNSVSCTAETLILALSPEENFGRTDAVIAASYLELYLQSQGVGTCWAGYLERLCNGMPALQAMLGMEANEKVCAALMAGYPREDIFVNIPKRKEAHVFWLD